MLHPTFSELSQDKFNRYQLAIAAKYHKVPFYVALPFSTIDRSIPDGGAIPIEQRSAEEIFHCDGAKVYNPAFDVTDNKLITAIITEKGICRAPYTESLASKFLFSEE